VFTISSQNIGILKYIGVLVIWYIRIANRYVGEKSMKPSG
jgi:hypothetical protein